MQVCMNILRYERRGVSVGWAHVCRWVYDHGCRGQCAGRWVKVGTSASRCVRMSGCM